MKSIPYGRQNIDKSDIDAVVSTLLSDYLTQGPKVEEFEGKFADYVGVNYAVSVNNATSGLHLSVLALDIKKGDRVITTPITFASSANCVRFSGGEVWFADINPDTYLLDINSVKKLIESKPKGFFKGIIPVDFAGLPINMEEYKELANIHNLWIIEDACHAPGGYFIDSNQEENFCGNCKYADIGVFSFHPVKHIACGEGGMITTNSKELYEKLILLRTHGITKKNMQENHGNWYYEMIELGYNYRLTDFQSALGITQLEKNKNGVVRRNEISLAYKKVFEGKIKFQDLPEGTYNAHHLFIIELERRKELYDFLKSKGILAQIHYIPVHTLPYYKKIGYEGADLYYSEKYYSNCISLPMFPTLSKKEQSYIIEQVLKFTNNL
ncbi:UDP-4-amino-4,6-dideoxy-N-acetyl-beta-L-altrosamine transaminase [Flavobacteriaceae bacterium]|nr:UDP-4-amino-4,6-dideoxy-N-acetyl-beta-L-altrosamine transaminase [Flavobacteriaceae bacterium]